MKAALLTFLAVILVVPSAAQVSVKDILMPQGAYGVGFRHFTATDAARTYHRYQDWSSEPIDRPIPVSLWYPAEKGGNDSPTLLLADYMRIVKEEEEWEQLPDDMILNWFEFPNTPNNQARMHQKVSAIPDAVAVKGRFPVIIYAASYQASSIENFSICEYLASHGFVVISSPSRGTDTRLLDGGSTRDMETQARDMEFLLDKVSQMPMADPDRIGTLDFSFGGLSAVLFQMRNERVKAVVSLDGSARYNYQTLEASAYANINRMTAPFLHMAQKVIPDQVLSEDNIDPRLNTEFRLFDSLKYSQATKMRFHHLSHSQFGSLGVLLKSRDPRQDKNDQEIVASYRLLSTYTLNFFRAHLMGDKSARNFIYDQNQPKELVDTEHKEPLAIPARFEDFHELVVASGYENITESYSQFLKKHPYFKPEEWKLNNLGLQLAYDKTTSDQGIQVLEFACSQFPNSSNLYDSLAEAQLFAGDTQGAIRSFKKSLELYSGNQNAINRLSQLEK